MAVDQLPSMARAIVFDWDNTLVDSWGTIHAAFNATLREYGKAEWTLDEVTSRVGKSLRDTFPDLFGDEWEQAAEAFYGHFADIHIERLTVLPGVPELLATLSKTGIPLVLVSNKTGKFLREEVAHLEWQTYFQACVGAGDAAKDKPAPDPVEMALAGTGVTPGPDVWFVGDGQVDILCAQATGCTSILVGPEATGQSGIDAAAVPDFAFPDCVELARVVKAVWNDVY